MGMVGEERPRRGGSRPTGRATPVRVAGGRSAMTWPPVLPGRAGVAVTASEERRIRRL
jgi:hypothetical protein